jgi:hypothetical protein
MYCKELDEIIDAGHYQNLNIVLSLILFNLLWFKYSVL